jgi:hypothetical protein
MKRLLFACTASAITVLSSSANAQVWLQDRRSTEGEGIRSGDLELHPGIAGEVGYDSNFFQRAPNNGSAGLPVVGTTKMRVTPSFSVSTLGGDRGGGQPPKVSLNAGAALVYSEYLTNTNELGRNRDFGVTADLALGIAPGRPLGFNIFDNFSRTAQPSLANDGTAGLNRDENRVAGEFVYTRPGGLLDWRIGYALGLTYFEAASAQYLNNYRNEVYTRGRWKFLPRTALVYDGSVQFIRYSNTPQPLPDSNPLRTRIGLSGLLTDRLSVLAMVGWGASFYKTPTVVGDFDGLIGQAELRYFFGGSAPEAGQPASASMSSVAIGFTRDFLNSYFTAFYEQDRGYLQISALFAQRFFLSLNGGIAAIRYSPALGTSPGSANFGQPITTNGFTDVRADASLFLEYRAASWLGFNLTGQYLGEFSNTKLPVGINSATGATLQNSLEFQRFQGLAGVRAFW